MPDARLSHFSVRVSATNKNLIISFLIHLVEVVGSRIVNIPYRGAITGASALSTLVVDLHQRTSGASGTDL